MHTINRLKKGDFLIEKKLKTLHLQPVLPFRTRSILFSLKRL